MQGNRPGFSTPRVGRRSPKEDGEIGETAQDVLDRHPALSPQMATCVSALRDYESELTPGIARAVGKLLSAALSPLQGKAEPEDAVEALQIVATKMLPERACAKRRRQEMHSRNVRAKAEALVAAVQREQKRAGENRKRMREEIAARPVPTHRTVDRLGRVHLSRGE